MVNTYCSFRTLVALNLGGGLFSWTDPHVLVPLVVGLVTLIGFAVYAWKGTRDGILHHELFQSGRESGRTFVNCIVPMVIEGLMLFSYMILYPIICVYACSHHLFAIADRTRCTRTSAPFESDPLLLTMRGLPGSPQVCPRSLGLLEHAISNRPLASLCLLPDLHSGFAIIQPGSHLLCLVFAGLAGLGFGYLSRLDPYQAGPEFSTSRDLLPVASPTGSSTRCRRASKPR